jgi:AcrR family transcriptional regulator
VSEAAPTRRRTTKAEQRAEKMEQILDAAEELFSRHGLYGVTLKDVAKRVGVHHTLMNYYFDDKKALFDAVFARRAVVTSERRMRALETYEATSAGKPTVEGALRAFLDTDLDLYIEGGEGWKNYAALGAQVANTPAWGADLMDEHFDPVVLRLIDLLKKALPDCPEADIFWGYHFVTGALMLTLARTGRIDKLSGGGLQVRRFPGREGADGRVHGRRFHRGLRTAQGAGLRTALIRDQSIKDASRSSRALGQARSSRPTASPRPSPPFDRLRPLSRTPPGTSRPPLGPRSRPRRPRARRHS